MATGSDSRMAHAAEAARFLEEALPQADAQRVQNLEALQRVRAVKASVLTREQARLAAKYGEGHPRVQALDQQIAANLFLGRQLAVEMARANTELVAPDPKTWTLQGRVMDREFQEMPGLTVALYDAKGRWVEAFGFDCTDSTGYFKISHEASPQGRSGSGPGQPQPVGLGTADSSPRPAGAEGTAASRSDAATEEGSDGPLFVHVLDSKSNTLHKDDRELTPAGGVVDYLEIILGDSKARDCAPPEGRKRAGPRPKK